MAAGGLVRPQPRSSAALHEGHHCILISFFINFKKACSNYSRPKYLLFYLTKMNERKQVDESTILSEIGQPKGKTKFKLTLFLIT